MSGERDKANQSEPANIEAAAERETLIRERAYYRWIREGLPAGRDFEHWLQAEKQIDAEQAQDIKANSKA